MREDGDREEVPDAAATDEPGGQPVDPAPGAEPAAAEPDEAVDLPDIGAWAAGARTATCPACGAGRALSLGGGVFCPACGVVSTTPGYSRPPAEPAP